MEIQYVGERLWLGNLGYLFVTLSFGAALLSALSYGLSIRPAWAHWRGMGRGAFYVHTVGVTGVVSVLGYLIANHFYEYHYVWSHSSNELPFEYMLACFWEGQEGSFLLWCLWQALLGLVLMRVARQHESGVMLVLALAQVMLAAMLLGLDLWGDDAKELGMNPFRLLRHEMEAPIFSQANYLSMISDGSGLNPLLQNYWNVIHPPVLFLGFALTIVPFAFLIDGLLTKQVGASALAALPWTGVGVGILGLGILMGGAWAYEALSFGGFWAWDPVENAVLVPWMVMVAGLHTLIIYKNTGKALPFTILLLALSFILILYSTFLTRSGVLGDASVHSFTDLGLSGQLMLFLGLFICLFLAVFGINYRHIPVVKSSDQLSSRELWMFVGSLLLLVAAFQVIFSTSIPVMNKVVNALYALFNIDKTFAKAPPVDPIAHYNQFQIPFAILIALLTGAAQYFKYRKTGKDIWKTVLRSVLISMPITAAMVWAAHIDKALHIALMATSVYALVGNIEILAPLAKMGKIRFAGAGIGHIGLALILLGSLISNGKKQVMSRNDAGIDFGEGFTGDEKVQNVLLPKGKPVKMAGYFVTYHTDSFVAPNHYYKVEYKKVDEATGQIDKRFYLYPKVQINDNMGLVSDPSIRRTLGWDLYTHVTSVPTGEEKSKWEEAEHFTVKIGDKIDYKDYTVEVLGIDLAPGPPTGIDLETDSLYLTALRLRVVKGDKELEMAPYFIIQGSQLQRPAAVSDLLGLTAFFVNIQTETKDFVIALSAKTDQSPDYIIMKAMMFPMINLLWLGSVLLFVGSILAAYRRFSELKRRSN
ncbi:MAG: cytochrome c biogenesis protein CcsA [Bacteroidetes bacterium]|nr:cytochrome c biogenesis protein CcsA [Bacteroidota bacterium]